MPWIDPPSPRNRVCSTNHLMIEVPQTLTALDPAKHLRSSRDVSSHMKFLLRRGIHESCGCSSRLVHIVLLDAGGMQVCTGLRRS
jgi:hypothetical protein